MYTFKIKYDSGTKLFDGVDQYYGAESLLGISRALLISLHSFLNNEVLVQAPAAKGFRVVLGTAKEGSWEQNLHLRITDQAVGERLNKLGKNALNDLLGWALNGSVGKSGSLNFRKSAKIARELERQNDDLHEHLEGAIKMAHAPVKQQGLKITVSVDRTVIAEFDESTLRYIETEIFETKPIVVHAAISRFNARTHTGRLISAFDASSTPFSPQQAITDIESVKLADNLAQLSRKKFVPIDLVCSRIISKDGHLKRYQLISVK